MKIKYVDAFKIRNTIESDFSGVATHADFAFIPKGELWVDMHLKDEAELFLALTKLEKTMKGNSFSDIRAKAQQQFTNPGHTVEIIRTERRSKYIVKYVDGGSVRRTYDPFFLLGGHGLVYDYIPKNEVWIDVKADPRDYEFTLLHELEEVKRMAKGMSYHDAHDYALCEEKIARRHSGVAQFIRN